MGKWNIGKDFEFDYGHRVWTQTLDESLSLTTCTKCRWPHGHRGKIVVNLVADELKNGMVMDFVELNWFKKFIDDVIDHKCIMDIGDPVIHDIYPLLYEFDQNDQEDVDFYLENFPEDYYKVWPNLYKNNPTHMKEIYDGLILVPFVPTSENLSKWFFDIVQKKLEGIATVSHIEFYETPKSKSIYYGTN